MGRSAEAEALFLALLQSSTEGSDHRAVIPAWLVLARIALARQQFEAARQRLHIAHDHAHALNHQRFLAQSHRLWADLNQRTGDQGAARASLGRAIDLFERMGMRRDLLEARAALAQLEPYLLERHVAA